ncbi:hypothetical protein DXG03_005898 [Asterophora parasitica]|uniref:Uncharacterized protein n=1 Tax=Asterophora parasitica TaxID=117018 RepID=A0A9P7GDT8_9AGAR|nr:hypothetical protein DXG03_005898 [Asterophora parasitica]
MTRIVIQEKRTTILPPKEVYRFIATDDSHLISRLQGVQFLKFQNISLGDIPPRLWSLIHNLDVKEVEVHRMSLDTSAIFRYICTLPALEAISISKSSIQVATPDIASLRPKLPLRIPFLDVSNLSRGVLDWFIAQEPLPPVHTFHSRASGAIDFRFFNYVRSVHFEGYLHPEEQAESRRFKDFMRITFTEISSSTLEKVSLTASLAIDETMLFFGIPDHVLLDIFSWGTTPGVLANVHGHALCDFLLSIRGLPPYQQPYMEQSLRKGPFASFASKGILSVKFL